jgi:23S rRNA (uracil1939-C5)-methyltransferase
LDICKYSFKSLEQYKLPTEAACQGCQLWGTPYELQLEHKKDELKKKLNTTITINVKTAGSEGLRTRFDFTVEDQKLGLYASNSAIVNIKQCRLLHPKLQEAYTNLQQYRWPIKKGSLRLRLSPDETWGLWLDLANTDVRDLLQERHFLTRLAEAYTIEIGQKGKRLHIPAQSDSPLKLVDPVYAAWHITDGEKLTGSIRHFTQPSWITSELLNETVLSWLPTSPSTLIEFGCGLGQFTVPMLKRGHKVIGFETEKSTLAALLENTKKWSADFDLNPQVLPIFSSYALVNPPRSGLTEAFIEQLHRRTAEKIIYISCFADTLARDLQKLSSNYALEDLTLVDQFPQSEHFESCALLQRIN